MERCRPTAPLAASLYTFALAMAGAAGAEIDFNRDIRPILSDNCFACHGPDSHERKAGLRLDTYEGAIEERDGVRAIDPGALAASEFIARVETDDDSELMPPPKSHKVLSAEQRALLKSWVLSGAAYEEHWAFLPPSRPGVPEAIPAPGRNPIDHFVGRRLAAAGMQFSPEADRATLIRRVSYDLTGLPPTPAEVEAFLADGSPDAYEKVVDRLLASPRYGERMTLAWMDAARYGDSSVMHADGPRDMWPWRDWVIRAYNANMPFDQFTVEQLAGDLLPDATVDQRVASGFNRNHATSDEGGAFAEELRVEYVVDRVQTTSNVWMALTMECGQCHDHKYDPISQREYYQMFAYFNNTTDPGMQTRNGNQAPVVEVPNKETEAALAEVAGAIAAKDAEIAAHKGRARPAFGGWLRNAENGVGEAKPEVPGLTHYFPLDEQEGDTISAQVGGGVGKLSGTLQSVARGAGRGLKFDAKSDFVFGEWPARERDQPFTFAAWLKLSGGGAGAVFARMDEGMNYRGYDLWVQGRAVGTHIINTWPGNALKVVSDRPLEEDKWQHVAVTYDGSSKQEGVKIYIDGQPVATKVEQNSLSATIATSTPFKIGSRSRSAHFNGEVDDLRIYGRALSAEEVGAIGGDPIRGILATPAERRSPEQGQALFDHYLATQDGVYQGLVAARADLAKRKTEIESRKKVTSMVMQDNPAGKTRVTYILDRGQYDQPIKEGADAVVPPGVPEMLMPLPEGAPANRLGLAQWLVADEHPLTARVAVNRYWAMLFGQGLVKTVGDFGNQSSPPSHPELLDWLAVDFVESGWDVKRALRQMVTSATYRQRSNIAPGAVEGDPENVLLGRSPRFRLQGEFIRDSALAVSGLLVERVGGPSVKPYQPPNIWNEVSLNGGLRYQQGEGEDLYRRSMYTYWKRSAPMPNMLIFDAPTREKCLINRPRTNTPLQALVVLNDPQFVEAARAFAQRVIREAGADAGARIERAFHLALSRPPTERESAILAGELERVLGVFKAQPEKAGQLLAVGESARDESIDPAEHAAWTVLLQIVLNMDEALTRG